VLTSVSRQKLLRLLSQDVIDAVLLVIDRYRVIPEGLQGSPHPLFIIDPIVQLEKNSWLATALSKI